MPPKATLYVAIDNNNESIYKHWSIFLKGPASKTILHVLGLSTKYYFDERIFDAENSPFLWELVHMCEVPVSKLKAIREVAMETPVSNEYPGFNCQDFVLEVLGALEEKGIIDGGDEDYRKAKDRLRSMQEGRLSEDEGEKSALAAEEDNECEKEVKVTRGEKRKRTSTDQNKTPKRAKKVEDRPKKATKKKKTEKKQKEKAVVGSKSEQ